MEKGSLLLPLASLAIFLWFGFLSLSTAFILFVHLCFQLAPEAAQRTWSGCDWQSSLRVFNAEPDLTQGWIRVGAG